MELDADGYAVAQLRLHGESPTERVQRLELLIEDEEDARNEGA